MPTFVYFPIAGRGELSRLIAKVGGIDLELASELPDGIIATACGSTGGLPCLIDDDLKINESGAIETYLCLIAPKFAELTPKQRAKDAQFCHLKETYIAAIAGVGFSMSAEERAAGERKDDIKNIVDKYFAVLETILPEDGFINGLEYPTPADLAIVNICEGYMPFGWAYKHAEIDLATSYPKLDAHHKRCMADDAIKNAVEGSASMKVPFPGF